MKQIIFFGSDIYSRTVLEKLLEASSKSKTHEILSVITDRPKPVEKAQLLSSNPVDKLANAHHIKVSYYPVNINEMNNFIATLENESKDKNVFGLCASFDHLVPKEIIEIFNGNLYNLHPSLLPQYRNVSPVQYAIALGDKLTGITLFRISVGIDNGEIVGQVSEPINSSDTTQTLTPKLFTKGAAIFIDFLNGKHSNNFASISEALIFTKRLTRDSGFVEWDNIQKLLANKKVSDTNNLLLNLRLNKSPVSSPILLEDLVRSLTPWPTLWTLVPSKKGELRVTIESVLPDIKLKIAGKPKSISYSDFIKYYID